MADDKKIEVTVVGGGIAGITAALRLAQRGYSVSIYNQDPVLGGNLGAYQDEKGGRYHDVYPHMFSTFYENFWQIVEKDLGWDREAYFQPRESVRIIRKGGEYVGMTDGASIRSAWENLWDGILPPADMLLWVYSILDMMSKPTRREQLLDAYSVNGFMGSRPYGTDRAAALHDFVLMVVWSAHSYGVPVSAYKDFFRFSLRDPSPLTWVLRGDLYAFLMKPLTEKLEQLGVRIHHMRRITKIVVEGGLIDEIEVEKVLFKTISRSQKDVGSKKDVQESARSVRVKVDNLILAVNPQSAGWLAQEGARGQRLVDSIPRLSETRRAVAEPVTVLRLHFKRKVPEIPREHVSVWDSRMNLSFLDLSQVWDDLKGGPTVLEVAASNYFGLPGVAVSGSDAEKDASAMVSELAAVVPQIKAEDIDWKSSRIQTVDGDTLFINTVSSERWRPPAFNEALPNLFMAGDYCRNAVSMATVEGAVTTGLLAARALHDQKPLGPSVEIIEHAAYSDAAISAMKLAMMPAAYQAKWWSAMTDVVRDAAKLEPPTGWGRELASLWWLPAHFALDYWETTSSLLTSSLYGPRERR